MLDRRHRKRNPESSSVLELRRAGWKALSVSELRQARTAEVEVRKHLIFAAKVDCLSCRVVLLWGDGTETVVPFSEFSLSGRDEPDFAKVKPIDFGHTLQLGKYEVAADTLDPVYLSGKDRLFS